MTASYGSHRTNQVPVRPASRNAVYDVIDGERDYQNGGEGNAKPSVGDAASGGVTAQGGNILTLGEGILCLEEILADARKAWYKPTLHGTNAAMPFIRKIGGVAVQLMENYGAVPREWHVPPSAGISGEMHIKTGADSF